ncbi:MAG: sterol desaturase family protein [Gammaproteobacteria bacterium]|nr:sterol desaturase family protein [Gammaproteobacteria bacterium]MYG67643.1 sterol desaturase family protein [Gammaproteobacteria bacterium]
MTNPAASGYRPAEPIGVPPLYAWPPRPLAALRYLFVEMAYPWGYVFAALSVVLWQWLTPSMETMATLSPDWMALVWLRNAAVLTLFAGGLHWWLYIRRRQESHYKFNTAWMARDDDRFTFGDQVRDNMFWSLASGVTVWTLYESLTWWWYASGHMEWIGFRESPVLVILMAFGVLFWSTFHFYLNHRLLHWRPLFDIAHDLHHRNGNTGPWSGISMHPVEHLIYFTLFFLWWVVPIHPALLILTGLYQGVGPAVTHCGFNRLRLPGGMDVPAGDYFHHLHHRFFHVNYGNSMTPLDKPMGSWHDGGEEGRALVRRRMRKLGNPGA